MIHIKLFKEQFQNTEMAYNKVISAKLGDVMPVDDIIAYAEFLHTKDDFGELTKKLRAYTQYKLQQIDVHDLSLGQTNPDIVDDYKGMLDGSGGFYPPVIADSNHAIIDGFHRANALADSGHSKINAWVGV